MWLFRIMLAAHLALGTPAWCCCMIKAVAATMTGTKARGCAADGCCGGRSGALAHIEIESCCSRGLEEVKRGLLEGGVAGGADSDRSPCNCHDELNDIVRLNTATQVGLPALVINALAGVLHTDFDAGEWVACQLWRDSGACRRAHPPPQPPQTLLQQGCQLLI